MRILLLTHSFYPEGVGGVSRYADSLARAFLARGHDVALLTTRSGSIGSVPGACYEDGEWQGLPVRRLTFNLSLAPNPYRYEWDNPWVNERMLQYVEQRRAEVVHLVHGGHLSMSAVPLLKASGRAVLASVLDYWFVCAVSNLRRPDGSLCDGPDWLGGECIRCLITRPWTRQDRISHVIRYSPNVALKALGLVARTMPDPPGRWASVQAQTNRLAEMRAYLAQLDAVLCPSQFVAGVLQRNGFDMSNVRLLPLGVQPVRVPRQARPRDDDVLRLGYLGRQEPAKGLHVLVDAMLALPRELPVHMLIRGYEESPEYVAALRARAAPDPRIRFHGEVPDPAAALADLDVFVMPSVVYEAYPLVIREAQAVGLPVLASDIGGIKEGVRHEVDGLHFRAGDPRSLARAIRRLLEEPGLLERLRANVQPPLDADQHAEALLELYAASIQRSRRPSAAAESTAAPLSGTPGL